MGCGGPHQFKWERERELPNLNGRGAHISLNGRERELLNLNGRGAHIILNGRGRERERFKWGVGDPHHF